MGLVYADVELINGFDEGLALRRMIGIDEVKRFPVNILVDTGSYMLQSMKISRNIFSCPL